MAEGTYEFEAMRAELLGCEPPDREVFEAAQKERMAAEKEQIDAEELKALDSQDEKLQAGSGKLDEINQILSITQQKLNKFKGVCGSLTNLLRIKADSKNNSTDTLNQNPALGTSSSVDPNLTINDGIAALDAMEENVHMTTMNEVRTTKSELEKKMTCNFDKLDSLINKAERAEMSMEKQNKQMKGMMR